MSKNWAYLMLSGSALFWSGNFVLGRAIATDIEPITLAYWRWLIALCLFLPFGLKYVYEEWLIIRTHLRYLLLMSVLGVSGFNTFVYLGLQETTATNALLINSFIPILIILLSRIKPGVPINRLKMLGIMVSSIGVVTLVVQGRWTNLLTLSFNRGDLWILGAALVWAVYSIGLRWRPLGLSSQAFLLITMIIGLIILAPFYWLNPFDEAPLVLNISNSLAIFYVAAFASIGAFLLWNQGVRLVGAATAGQFIHLMPVLGTLMAIVLLEEQLYGFHLIGAVAIAAGILLSLKSNSTDY